MAHFFQIQIFWNAGFPLENEPHFFLPGAGLVPKMRKFKSKEKKRKKRRFLRSNQGRGQVMKIRRVEENWMRVLKFSKKEKWVKEGEREGIMAKSESMPN